MKVIASRKKGIEYLYAFSSLLGLFIIIMGCLSEEPIMMLLGIVAIVISMVVLIGILSTPKDVIILNEVENKVHLPKQKVVKLTDIKFVAYKKAKAKHHEYKWGEVHIQIGGQHISALNIIRRSTQSNMVGGGIHRKIQNRALRQLQTI